MLDVVELVDRKEDEEEVEDGRKDRRGEGLRRSMDLVSRIGMDDIMEMGMD